MKMWGIMMLMIFLYIPHNIGAIDQCSTIDGTTLDWSKFNKCKDVMLKNKNIELILNEKSHNGNLTKLDLSYNKLEHLPEGFLSPAMALKEVHLEGNHLIDLPEMFLSSSSSLQILSLEHNQLTKIPTSVFHDSLVNLTVDCNCALVSNIMMYLNGTAKKFFATCQTSEKRSSLENFYKENCGKQYLALYIALPILMIGLIIIGVAVYMWKRKIGSTGLENKGSADMSPAHVQPRYTSRNIEGTATSVSPGHRQDYENVFVGHLGTSETKPYGYRKSDNESGTTRNKYMAEEDIYLESDINEGDQPIYTNTQGIYYNYSQPGLIKSKSKEEDDVYILPDQ